jgi:uncharacterized glyoxalase superfamily protein PhnB
MGLQWAAMTANRSVPTDTVLPHVVYRCVPDAISWLGRVFGFVEHYRYGAPGGPVNGAQVYAGHACIMLRRASGHRLPDELGFCTQSLTVFMDDVKEHYARAREEGARITEPLHETAYGELQYGVEDLDGHHWLFSQHARDVSPEDWGARLSARSNAAQPAVRH